MPGVPGAWAWRAAIRQLPFILREAPDFATCGRHPARERCQAPGAGV